MKLRTPQSGDRLFMQLVIPAMCAGNIMGPAGEVIKGIAARTGSTLLVEPKLANAAFIPFRLVNFSCPGAPALSAAVGEVMDRLVQDEKYADGAPRLAFSFGFGGSFVGLCVGSSDGYGQRCGRDGGQASAGRARSMQKVRLRDPQPELIHARNPQSHRACFREVAHACIGRHVHSLVLGLGSVGTHKKAEGAVWWLRRGRARRVLEV